VQSFSYDSVADMFTVPPLVDEVVITAIGVDAGGSAFGRGAQVNGHLLVHPGDMILTIPGGGGGPGNGGGGGSWVALGTDYARRRC
jgi:hypothetical protein